MNRWIVSTLLLFFSTGALANDLLDPLFAQSPSNIIKLSPDGEYYAIAQSGDESATLTVYSSINTNTKNSINLAELFEEETTLRSIKWLDNQYIAVSLINKSEIETALFERNLRAQLLIFDTLSAPQNPIIYQVITEGSLVEPATLEPGFFYFARAGRVSKVYKIEIEKLLRVGQKRSKLTRVDGGQFIAQNVVAEVDGFSLDWFFDASDKVSAALFYNLDGDMELSIFNDTTDDGAPTSNTIKTWSKSEFEKTTEKYNKPLLLPIAQTQRKNEFYAMDFYAPNQLNLYIVDYETDSQEQIFTSPSFPIQDIIFNHSGEAIGVVVVEQGVYKEEYFEDHQVAQTSNNFDGTLELVLQQSSAQDIKLIYQESHNNPGKYLVKYKQQTPTVVLKDLPKVPYEFETKQIISSANTEDATIPYILTLPKKASNTKPAPLILMPHGGPFDIYDTPYFDRTTQFFASNGFAVLRVNYRGSGGYGIEHRDAGKQQWGGIILQDLMTALDDVKRRADIDAKRTCVVGISYGGYAALMLGLNHPESFACLASIAGVSDMNLFLRNPHISEKQHKWLKEYVGDAEVDYAKLKEISPVYQVSKLSRPLLMIHGMEDRIVSVEHAFRVKLLLDKANIKYEWKLMKDAGHQFDKADQSVQLFSSLLSFVQTHIGSDQNSL